MKRNGKIFYHHHLTLFILETNLKTYCEIKKWTIPCFMWIQRACILHLKKENTWRSSFLMRAKIGVSHTMWTADCTSPRCGRIFRSSRGSLHVKTRCSSRWTGSFLIIRVIKDILPLYNTTTDLCSPCLKTLACTARATATSSSP